MTPCRVAEPLDVVEYVGPDFVACAVCLSCHTLGLQGAEEALHRGVVPDLASTTHAALNTLRSEKLLEVRVGYASEEYRKMLKEAGFRGSMSSG